MADETEKMNHTNNRDNGVYVNISSSDRNLLTLQALIYRLISSILYSSSSSPGLIRRIKISFAENIPLFPEASRNTSSLLLAWARRGTPLRSILLISVGTITLLNLTGLLLFTLFFAAATLNAVVISLLFSLAAAGGFFAVFFACLTAIYITALSVTAFVVSITTVSTVIAVLVATGWIGFFWTIWLLTKTSFVFTKHSLAAVTGSTVSAYSYASSRLTESTSRRDFKMPKPANAIYHRVLNALQLQLWILYPGPCNLLLFENKCEENKFYGRVTNLVKWGSVATLCVNSEP